MAINRSVGLAALTSLLCIVASGCGQIVEPASSENVPQTAAAEPKTETVHAMIEHPDLGACPDEGPRLPLSRICAGRAINYIQPSDDAQIEAPENCRWEIKELPFGPDVMLYRALSCKDTKTMLTYSGGANAAEFHYASSVLSGAEDARSFAVRVQPEVDGQPDFRLVATFTALEGVDPANCEIVNAGDAYPLGARQIQARLDSPGAYCGEFAASDLRDVFWLAQDGYVFAFVLPKGMRDIDPVSFTLVKPY